MDPHINKHQSFLDWCFVNTARGFEAVLRWIMSLRNNPSKTDTETVSFEIPRGPAM